MGEIISALTQVILPMNLLNIFIGTLLGIVVGALPGLSSPMAIVVLIPITYGMNTMTAMLLLMGVYVGTKLGGSYPAILLRTPGTPASACTAVDGFPMAEKGKAGYALGYATMGSAVGGIVGFLFCLLVAPLISKIAIGVGNADIALIAIVGLVMVSTFCRGSMLKGVIGILIGLVVSTVGLDPVGGSVRFTFGNIDLMSGIPFISALVGIFAICVVLSDIERIGDRQKLSTSEVNIKLPKMKEFLKYWKAIMIGSLYGIFFGTIPGVGAEASTWISYATVKNSSKHPELFGTGMPEGILAPEASNNAVTGGTMIPLLNLGLPGDGSTAVLLGALVLHGITPGITFFEKNPTLAYGIILSLPIATLFMFIIGWKAIKYFIFVLQQDRSWIFPFILIFAMTGSYAISNTIYPVLLAIGFGILGFIMELLDFPVITVVMGIILGPIIELNLRIALAISNIGWLTLVSTWPRIILIGIILYVFFKGILLEFFLGKTHKRR